MPPYDVLHDDYLRLRDDGVMCVCRASDSCNGTWREANTAELNHEVHMDYNNFMHYTGNLTSLNRMEGTAVNDNGFQETWEATRCEQGACDNVQCN